MDVDRAILQTFHAETAENLATIQGALLAIEQDPHDPEVIGALFRAVHTIKGNAEALGVTPITRAAHAVEDVLAAVRSGRVAVSSALVDVLLDAHDAMVRALAANVAGTERPMAAELCERLAHASRGELADAYEAAKVPEAVPGGERGRTRARTLRVEVSTLDRIVTALEELVVSRGRIEVALHRGTDASDALAEVDRSFDVLRELVMRLRLVDAGVTLRAQARSVRDLARATGKRVRLVVDAGDVEVDTSVLEALRDPLTHMVRNAVDHGIEPPEARMERGKDAVGTIALRARREAGRFVVEVADDGAGLSRARILAKARALGLVRGDEEELLDEDVFRLVLAPGFSTAETVTALSGRGVGMDVVARAVASLGGVVEIDGREGRGTTFRLRVPLSLSLIDGFTVDVEHETYVVPLESVRECVELPRDVGRDREEAGVLSLRGDALPFVRLRRLFGLGGEPSREDVLVVEHEGLRAGLAVDVLHGRRQAVMKPLADVLRGSRVITGTSLLGDGRVALVLDVPAILREIAGRTPRGPAARLGEA
jgi:two-component system chemotaxis sensor kinase CheA